VYDEPPHCEYSATVQLAVAADEVEVDVVVFKVVEVVVTVDDDFEVVPVVDVVVLEVDETDVVLEVDEIDEVVVEELPEPEIVPLA